MPGSTYGVTRSTNACSAAKKLSSLFHSVSSASKATMSNGRATALTGSAMDRIEVVVHGDPRDTHRVADVLHSPAQGERTPLVEHADRALLVLTAEVRETGAELALDG